MLPLPATDPRTRAARAEAILGAMPDALSVIDGAGRFLEIVTRPGEPLPAPAAALIGRLVYDVLPPEVVEPCRAGVAAALRGEGPVVIEYETRYADGPHAFEARLVASGPDEVLIVRRDISGRKEAEAQRRLLATILRGMTESVTVTDLRGHIRVWSPGAEQIYGWRAEEVMGQHLPTLLGTGLPEGPAFDAWRDRLLAQGVSEHPGTRRRKDGTLISVETTFSILRDEAGRPEGILAVARDVTAAVAARSRELDEARLRGLEQRMNEAEIVVAPGGELVHLNDRALALYGYTREEAAGLRITDLRAPEELAGLEGQLAVAQSRGLRFDTRHRAKDGRVFPVGVSSRPFELGGTRYLHSLVRDLTAQRAGEAALASAVDDARRALAQRDQVLAVVAHDLRGPLFAVDLTAQGLITDPTGQRVGATVVERAILIRDAAARMRHLVDDLVDAAALESGALRLAVSGHDLAALAAEALRLAAPEAERAGVRTTLAATGPAPVRCDRDRLLQVLGNLLANALRMTPGGGAVMVRVTCGEDEVEAAVEDTGPGLPPDTERLFEPFERGAGVPYRGAGLGLTIARGIVSAHGGRLRACPAPGGGASFRLTLPRFETAPATPG